VGLRSMSIGNVLGLGERKLSPLGLMLLRDAERRGKNAHSRECKVDEHRDRHPGILKEKKNTGGALPSSV